jgi:hypothetical protein
VKLAAECPHRSVEPTASEKEDGRVTHYWSCPIKLVPPSVKEWYEKYKYETEFSGCPVPPLQLRPRRYLLMWRYYKAKLVEYDHAAQRRRERG